MADYVTVAEIKSDMPDSDIGTLNDYDTVISTMITSASRLIDKEVGGWENYFDAPSTDETRYFDGSGEKEQYIDPLVSLTTVSVSESGGRSSSNYTSWTEDTDFYVWPYNYARIGKPIEKLVVDNDSGSKGAFAEVSKGIKVVGKFGYSASPPDVIKQAVRIQVNRWFMRAKQGWQDASASERLGQMIYIKSLDPDVKRLLDPYRIGNMVMP